MLKSRPILWKVLFAAAFVTMALGMRWDRVAQAQVDGAPTGWCTCYDGTHYWNAPCDECPTAPIIDDDGDDDWNDGGEGYGGCATTGEWEGGTPERTVGSSHPDHPNVVWTGDAWRARSGYKWVSDDPDDLRVTPIVGYPHPNHPHVVQTERGWWRPADGYQWASENPPGDWRVVPVPGYPHPRYPNVVQTEDGMWRPADGYEWVADDPPGDWSVRPVVGYPHPRHPNTLQAADGTWEPRAGYRWTSNDPNDLETEPIPGYPHPRYPNVVQTADGKWQAAEGYRWTSDDPQSLLTEPIPGYPHPRHPHVVQTADGKWRPADGYHWVGAPPDDWAVELDTGLMRTHAGNLVPAPGYLISPDDPTALSTTLVAPDLQRGNWVSDRLKSLKIIDVPSPVLFTGEELLSYAQTQAMASTLDDAELARRIARTEYVLGVLRTASTIRSDEFEAIRAQAEQAEHKALVASATLFLQGLVPKMLAVEGNDPLARETRHLAARASEALEIINATNLATASTAEKVEYENALKSARSTIANAINIYAVQVHGYYNDPSATIKKFKTTGSVAKLAALGFWAKDYLGAAMEWQKAYDLYTRISGSDTSPEALNVYQRQVGDLYETLIEERNRRATP